MATGKQEHSRGEAVGDSLHHFTDAARSIKKSFVDPRRDWYAKHQSYPFYMFRVCGIVTIVLGVILPVITVTDLQHKDVVMPVVSLTIAVLTGVSNFFRWERSWRGREQSKFAIDALEAKWELELAKATHVLAEEKRLEYAYTATNDFFTNVRIVSAAETDEFFSGMQFPQVEKPEKTGEK
ncbi:DUF4231 domain-containing protein [Pseudomonas entomophila]|uniref:DUF4231 domain-containing protein n=1 Tax=Pseudomonas entomophila TaxID=312306 RepID=A0ABY9QIS2_9PSED|nr:DUF4231 domain-containing protein [Pseudomonas entomophila]WMW03892.1 DUF4231 domain-containing protein [Pseudomonas entomophila]